MSTRCKLPYTHIFYGPSHTIAISGANIYVLDSKTGNILNGSSSYPEAHAKLLKSGPIRCASVDYELKHVITAGDDKVLRVWQVDQLRLINERELPKKLTCIRVTRDGQTVLVSDKFGDIYKGPLVLPEATPDFSGTAATPNNVSSTSFLMGHASLLTTFLLTPDEKYIVSADRDEHIRVSCFPDAYVIERFCLGHQKFVSAIHVPAFDPMLLVSGGGDPVLKIWNWMSGDLHREIHIADAVLPFVKVKRAKRRRRCDDGDEDRGRDAAISQRQRRKERKKKTKGNGKAQQDDPVDDSEEEPNHDENFIGVAADDEIEGPADSILAIHKIDSLETAGHRFLLFDSVGASALFYTTYPSDPTHAPEIQHVDFGSPVLDFVQRSGDEIWVTLDGNWSEGSDMVKVIKYGKLIEATDSAQAELLQSLNGDVLTPATTTELKSLELYSWLSTMPKTVDLNEADNNSGEMEGSGPEPGKPLSLRQEGRLKRKQAILAKKAGLEEAGAGTVARGDARDVKRAKGQSEVEMATDE